MIPSVRLSEVDFSHLVRDERLRFRDGYLKAVRLGGTDKDPRQLRFTRAAVDEAVAALPTYDPAAASKGGA